MSSETQKQPTGREGNRRLMRSPEAATDPAPACNNCTRRHISLHKKGRGPSHVRNTGVFGLAALRPGERRQRGSRAEQAGRTYTSAKSTGHPWRQTEKGRLGQRHFGKARCSFQGQGNGRGPAGATRARQQRPAASIAAEGLRKLCATHTTQRETIRG